MRTVLMGYVKEIQIRSWERGRLKRCPATFSSVIIIYDLKTHIKKEIIYLIFLCHL